MPTVNTLNQKVLVAAVWSVGLRFAIKCLALVNTVVLARLLAPEDFGLVAIVMSIYLLIDIFQSFGFDVVLIQKQNASSEVYDTAWTIQVIFGFVTGGVMIVAAPFIAEFYGDPRLQAIAMITSVFFVFDGLKNIGLVNFRKELDFKKEFAYQSSVKIFSVAVTIAVAAYMRNYWALLIGMFCTRLFGLGFSYYMSLYRPRLTLQKWRDIIGFSSWLFINAFMQFLVRNASNLTVGKLVGVSGSGIYTYSNEFAELPSGTLVAAVNRATFPGYSKVSHDAHKLRDLYVRAMAGIASIGIPASVFMSVYAPEFVPVLLGAKWTEAIPVIQILGLAYAFVSVNTNVGYIFHSVGKPHVPTLANVFRSVVLLSLLALLVPTHGIIGAAYAFLVLVLIMFPVYFLLLRRVIPISLAEYLSPLVNPILGSLAMFVFMRLGVPQLGIAMSPSLPGFLLLSLGGGLAYLLTVAIAWALRGRQQGPESFVFDMLSRRLTR